MAKSALEILDENPDLFKGDKLPIGYDNWLKVTEQATRHTQRSDFEDLHKISRPLEEEMFTKWRKDNRRHITNAPISKMERMLISTTKRNGIGSLSDLDEENREVLKQWQFEEFGMKSFEDFKQKILISTSLEDPNGLLIDFPFNPNNEHVPPANSVEDGGLPENESVESKTIFIPSSDRRYYDNCMVSWILGTIAPVGNEKSKHLPFYMMLDDDAFWIVLPHYIESKTVYKAIPWYTHGLGKVPYSHPPSIVKRFTEIDNQTNTSYSYYYRETYAWQTYEHLDQVVVDFSQSQVNRVKLSNSILVMNGEIECSTCGGTKFITEEHGSRKQKKTVPCTSCMGSGKFNRVGQFSTVKVRTDGENSVTNPIAYVSPDTSIGTFGETIWKEHIRLAEDAFCVDPLEGSPTEAVASKEMRQQPKQEMINAYGDDLTTVCEEIISNRLSILRKELVEIKLPRPNSYAVKSAAILREEARTALPIQRRSKTLDLIRLENMGNDLMIRRWEVATKVCPEMLLTSEEIADGVSSTAFDDTVYAKKEYIMCAMEDIIQEGSPNLTFIQYRDLVNTWMIDNGIIEEDIVFTDEDGEEVIEGQVNEIANTVGGVQGIIAISQAVSDGSMTEAAAENLLITVYGYSKEKAASLIDVPERKIDISLEQETPASAEPLAE